MLDVLESARDEKRIEQRVARLRDEAQYLVDEVFEWEGQLPYPPERICPGCGQHARRRAAH
ncbi:MAG: hypothetical protein ACREN2_06085 [Candidatus Dormibacteria bacterium]